MRTRRTPKVTRADSPTASEIWALRKFARTVLQGYNDGECGDIDGYTLERLALRLRLIVPFESGDTVLYGLAPVLIRIKKVADDD